MAKLEDDFNKLEEIINSMENNEMSLEEAFKAYEEGVKLVAECNAQIDKVEKQLIILDNDESVLRKYLPKKEGYQKIIFEAMEYALMAGGKRLRPMFMNEVYMMFGGDDKDIIEPFMAAIEMIHTYSLIHDDLPAMDDDDYRRGRKTTHVVYGEAMGILAGDALLNYAYETAAKALLCPDSADRAAKAFAVLAKKAGVFGMVGGQALLEASFMIGGILAGASDEEEKELEMIARNVGIAFQIQDDILDITSTSEVLGKPVGSDEKNEKTTYVYFFGIDKAKQDVKKYSEEALDILKDLDAKGDKTFVEKLINDLIYREK